MNKYFYDDIFISVELGRQSASTGRATSSKTVISGTGVLSVIRRRRLTVKLLSLLTPTKEALLLCKPALYSAYY